MAAIHFGPWLFALKSWLLKWMWIHWLGSSAVSLFKVHKIAPKVKWQEHRNTTHTHTARKWILALLLCSSDIPGKNLVVGRTKCFSVPSLNFTVTLCSFPNQKLGHDWRDNSGNRRKATSHAIQWFSRCTLQHVTVLPCLLRCLVSGFFTMILMKAWNPTYFCY